MSALGGLLGDYVSDDDSGASERLSKDSEEGGGPEGGSEVTGGGGILDKLPPPKVGSKRAVRFVLPFDVAALAEDDDDEEEGGKAKKILKVPGKEKSRLLDYLPPPKQQPKNPFLSMPPRAPQIAKIAPEPSNEKAPVVESNEMYRVDYEAAPALVETTQATQAQVDARVEAPLMNEPLVKQGKKSRDSLDHLGIEFKEINQADLKYIDPAVRESANSIGTALGSEYATQLRGQAAPFKGNKFAKRKHQIGTLYHDMKMNELEAMANKAQGMKSKHETEAKYGWR